MEGSDMEIKSFRIKNYRSIKDSGVCYMSGDNITILAGKNESGKTVILEALEDFNIGESIRKDAIPLNDKKSKPEIVITFQIDKDTLKEIYEEIGLNIKVTKPINIEIIKIYPKNYILSEESVKELGFKDENILGAKQKNVENTYKQLNKICQQFPQIADSLPKLNLENVFGLRLQLLNFKNKRLPNLLADVDANMKNAIIQEIDKIVKIILEIENLRSAEKKFITKIKDYIPNFILFSSFDDIFPSEIPLAEAADNELIQDLDIISNLDLPLVKSGSASLKATHKKQLNVRLREEYSRFWEQDLTNLSIDWDSTNLLFFITEGDHFYPPNMRSKGKQWHLAFYVRVSARAKEDVPNIILIDEPGLYLHAQAQKDVIRKLEDSAEYTPIIFATHSPYLIDIDKLSRIRLISRNSEEEGTLISNKIHKYADKETLTPIITAIGLDLSLGLDIAKDNNAIFEGITDYYYLRAFAEFLKFKFKKDVHFIPGAGADKTNLLASLMIGWGFNYCVVLDNDATGIRIRDRLIKDFRHTNIKIVLTSENKDDEVEDLFSRGDFIKYVLAEKSSEVAAKKNSQIIKQKGKSYDKVLLSKSFYEKALQGGILLTATTNNNFNKLLERINSSMFPES